MDKLIQSICCVVCDFALPTRSELPDAGSFESEAVYKSPSRLSGMLPNGDGSFTTNFSGKLDLTASGLFSVGFSPIGQAAGSMAPAIQTFFGTPIASFSRLIALLAWLICAPIAHGETTSFFRDKERFSEYLRYPWEAMRIGSVATSYKKVFAPYLPLKWIRSPVLGEAGKLVDDPELGQVVIYVVCRPHACETERLVFVYKPSTDQAWGKVQITSGVIGMEPNGEAEKLFNKHIGEMK